MMTEKEFIESAKDYTDEYWDNKAKEWNSQVEEQPLNLEFYFRTFSRFQVCLTCYLLYRLYTSTISIGILLAIVLLMLCLGAIAMNHLADDAAESND